MNKTDLLFQMLEHPHDYSEAQWREILADDECRELYTLMAKTKSAARQAHVTDEAIDAEWQRLAQAERSRAAVVPLWRKIAAAAAIVVAFFGITIAAVQTDLFGLVPSGDKVESDSRAIVQNERTEVTLEETTVEEIPVNAEPRLYDNVTLEQMLTELAAYYQVDVEYRSDDVRSVRLYYQWEPDYSLDKVVEMLSHFEAFSIHREGDRLVVESSSQEGE